MTATWSDRTDKRIGRALRTEGGHLSIRCGGFTLYYDRDWFLGYHCDGLKAVCIASGPAGDPVIHSHAILFEGVYRLAVHALMIAVGRRPIKVNRAAIPGGTRRNAA